MLGGARSGKSSYAEELALSLSKKVCYLATARITDKEMEKRVALHQRRRPQSWKTIELSQKEIEKGEIGRVAGCDVLLLDCITNLLYRLLEKYGLDRMEVVANSLEESIEKEISVFIKGFIKYISHAKEDIIIVSNEVGLGLVPPYPLGRVFRDLLGFLNKEIAGAADEVYLFVAGLKQRLK